jgi:transcriptional regulator with XRE-family HTH domain
MAICARLKSFRAGAGYPRRLFANHVGLDSSTIVRIELGRTPLKYADAQKICGAFSINPVWLATGKDTIRLWRPMPRAFDLGAGTQSVFSEVFDAHLAGKYESEKEVPPVGPKEPATLNEHISSFGRGVAYMFVGANQSDEHVSAALVEVLGNPLPVPEMTIEAARHLAEGLHRSIMSKSDGKLPPSVSARLSTMLEPGKSLHDYYQYILKKAEEVDKGKLGYVLTNTETLSKVGVNVKLQLPELLERLKKATAETGKKSELAEFLKRATKSNVPLASVSRWLSGEREPGGEIALQMDAWATAQGFPRAK